MDSFEFNDKCTPFNDVKLENDNFLIDHLNYAYDNFAEIYPEQNNLTNNIVSDHDDDDEEEGEEEQEEEEEEEEERWEEYYEDELDDDSVS